MCVCVTSSISWWHHSVVSCVHWVSLSFSVSCDQRLSGIRRSSRLRNPSETPQVALRHKLKQKLHEVWPVLRACVCTAERFWLTVMLTVTLAVQTATQSPLPPSKRARTPGRSLKTPAVLLSPALYDDDVTPRGLLRGIIQTGEFGNDASFGRDARPRNTSWTLLCFYRNGGVSAAVRADRDTSGGSAGRGGQCPWQQTQVGVSTIYWETIINPSWLWIYLRLGVLPRRWAKV